MSNPEEKRQSAKYRIVEVVDQRLKITRSREERETDADMLKGVQGHATSLEPKKNLTYHPKTSNRDIYGRTRGGSERVPEAKGEQREALSVVWSRGVVSVDPWRVPSRASELPGVRLFLCERINVQKLFILNAGRESSMLDLLKRAGTLGKMSSFHKNAA